jgi:hypothetical protein
MRYDAEFFCAPVLSDIERNLCDGKRRKMVQGVCIHLDNAPAHNAEKSRQGMVRTRSTGVVHPAYSPAAVPSDFFLSGCLKAEMAGFTANSPADIRFKIRRIFQEISKETLMTMYDEWITDLEWITEHKEEYFHMEEKQSRTL